VVTLRAWREADLPALVEACQDEEIPRRTLVPSPYGEQEARAFFDMVRADEASGKRHYFAVVDSDEALLGSIAVRVLRDERVAELGYWVAASARGRGVATRAVRLASHFAIESLGLARVQIMIEPDNAGSQRVAAAAGFTREGLLRSYKEQKGRRIDLFVYSLLPAELPGSS
jgi:RimJ/RimL family protein N-acetyltransferase